MELAFQVIYISLGLSYRFRGGDISSRPVTDRAASQPQRTATETRVKSEASKSKIPPTSAPSPPLLATIHVRSFSERSRS